MGPSISRQIARSGSVMAVRRIIDRRHRRSAHHRQRWQGNRRATCPLRRSSAVLSGVVRRV